MWVNLVMLLYCLCVSIQTQHSNRDVFYHIAVALIDNKGLSPSLADRDYCGSMMLKRFHCGFLDCSKQTLCFRVEVVGKIVLNGATVC